MLNDWKQPFSVTSRIIPVVLAICTLLPLGCGHPVIQPPQREITLPKVSQEREIVEQAGAETLRQYIIAQLITEQLGRIAGTMGREEAFAEVARAENAWQRVEETAEKTKAMAIRLEESEQEQKPASPSAEIFFSAAYASMPLDRDHEEAVEKAKEELIRAYVAYPFGRQTRILAEQIGQDAKAVRPVLEEMKQQAPSSYGETIVRIRSKCRVKILFGGKEARIQRANSAAEEAAAELFGGSHTIADIHEESSKVLLNRNPDVLYLMGDAKIIEEQPKKILSQEKLAGFLSIFTKTNHRSLMESESKLEEAK